MNPWNLTPREAAVLDAYIEEGSAKAAALRLERDFRTVSTLMNRARLRMQARTRIHCVLMWDRFRRGVSA
jgi:DNA-directed RNA polymerase specialized sigma24 family protein